MPFLRDAVWLSKPTGTLTVNSVEIVLVVWKCTDNRLYHRIWIVDSLFTVPDACPADMPLAGGAARSIFKLRED